LHRGRAQTWHPRAVHIGKNRLLREKKKSPESFEIPTVCGQSRFFMMVSRVGLEPKDYREIIGISAILSESDAFFLRADLR
jgi:hypothetical protein